MRIVSSLSPVVGAGEGLDMYFLTASLDCTAPRAGRGQGRGGAGSEKFRMMVCC